MKSDETFAMKKSVGIIGFGAFGQLIARHISAHFDLLAYDLSPNVQTAADLGVDMAPLGTVAQCDVVILATPVALYGQVAAAIAPNCRKGALVIDVGSVKVQPAQVMERVLPSHVDIIATHPLFGPESARDGVRGLKIAVCPVRGSRHRMLSKFLSKKLGLEVIETTPEDHDREAATVQGLTHLIAKVLVDMGPLPTRMTTRSFDLLVEAISMVQHDAPEVFDAIENMNPYAQDVRQRFFGLAAQLDADLRKTDAGPETQAPV